MLIGDIFQTVFGAETQETFIKFLHRIFGIDVSEPKLKSKNNEGLEVEVNNPYFFLNDNFYPKTANKIVEDLFTQQEKDKLARLINELKNKNSSLIEWAEKEERAELESDKEGYIRGVFNEVKVRVPESLTLLALIKIDSSHFEKSYKFLTKMWEELDMESGAKKPNCELGALRVCIWDALDDLETLVSGEKGQSQIIEEGEGLEKQTEQNTEKYLKSICEKIKRELEKESVKESELDTEIQTELTSLKNGDFNNKEVIDEIKKKVSDNIKLKKAEKELDKLLGSYKQQNFSPKMRKRLLQKLNDFTKNNNPFYQQVYQKRKAELEKLIKQLESDNHSQQIDSVQDNFPLAAKSMIGGYLLMTLIIIFRKIPKLRK